MLAQQTVYALGLFKEMSEVLNNDKISCWCTDKIDRLKKAINSDAVWDGEWYRRIIYKNKKPIGTKDCAEAKIFLNSQSWAVISNVADEQRSKQILQKADEYLSTPYGFKLLTPPYTGIELPLQFNAPGISENAGVFNHANTWAIIASALTGDGNKTFEYYSRTLPPNVIKTVGDDKYINEPYCYSSHIISEPEPRAGMALLSWLSGTCTWMYIAGTEYILGIRATLNGLSIKPCIPHDWDGYEAVKNYRGVKYNILVKRGDKKGIYLDAEKINGNILPIIVDKNEVDIFVGI
jgi:cellobiose phosphorylase